MQQQPQTQQQKQAMNPPQTERGVDLAMTQPGFADPDQIEIDRVNQHRRDNPAITSFRV